MVIRLVDALTDPFVGRLVDQRSSPRNLQNWSIASAILMTLSYTALINPPDLLITETQILTYMALLTLVVSVSTGALNVTVQAWPIRWTKKTKEQSDLVGRREQFTLIGVVIASTLSTTYNSTFFTIYLSITAFITCLFLNSLPNIGASINKARNNSWKLSERYILLFIPLFVSSLANAIAATVFIFFVTDFLGFSQSEGGSMLGVYFVSALIGVWVWKKIISTSNLMTIYLVSLLLTVAAFIPTLWLDQSVAYLFLPICIITGVLLGAELILPSLILIRQLMESGDSERSGMVFGTWSLLVKLALAAAAGMALPVLGLLGYQPNETMGHYAVPLVYVVVPVCLKIITIALFYAYQNKISLHSATR